MNDLAIRTQVVSHRAWKSDPDGPNDRAVDVWYNGSWVPAFFSDLKKGDFFLDLKADLEPGKCFLAKSDVRRSVWKDVASFVTEGIEVTQAPAIKDITPLAIGGDPHKPLLENK